MFRLFLCCITLTVILAPTLAEEPPRQPNRLKPALLTAPITFEANDDPQETLGGLLDTLSVRHEIRFDVNEAAFQAMGLDNVLDTRVVEKKLTGPNQTTLDALLRKLLARVPADGGATYMVRRDRIEITTRAAQREEVWGREYEGPFLPLVHTELEKKPLAEALDELAAASGFNVLIDARVSEKAKTAVSARLLNTPLDTAVGLLADMAELKALQTDNLLYVTSRENAERIEKREREKQAIGEMTTPRRGSLPVPQPGPGL